VFESHSLVNIKTWGSDRFNDVSREEDPKKLELGKMKKAEDEMDTDTEENNRIRTPKRKLSTRPVKAEVSSFVSSSDSHLCMLNCANFMYVAVF